MKLIPIDFEYKNTQNPNPELVAVALQINGTSRSLWLHQNKRGQKTLKNFLLKVRKDHTFISFNVVAEARCFIALGLDPRKFKWVDLMTEYKMLTNHDDNYRYGKHLFPTGVKRTFRPDGPDDKRNNARPPINLLGMTYKLLGIQENPKEKKEMISLILDNETYSTEQAQKILAYCESDIGNLLDLYHKVTELHHDPEGPRLFRGKVSANTAIMEHIGYPVDLDKVNSFVRNVPQIIKTCQEDIISQFPDKPPFSKVPKLGTYKENQKELREWIYEQDFPNWLKTAKGSPSLSEEAWVKYFPYRHDFPRNNLGAQMLRYKHLIKSLNGFKPKPKTAANKETFMDSVGSDGRVRSYLNPYGAQTSRFQPKATGFIPLKAAWMRNMIQAKPGKIICGIDYASQEFLISALLSNDKNMIEAYKSTDPYLYFAKLAGAVPWEGTKEEYKTERNRFKSTTLGLSYGMMAKSLANKLTVDTGEPHTEDDAQELIDLFYESYPDYAEFRENIIFNYEQDGRLALCDDWTMFGDNDRPLSVQNFPVQGTGAAILRTAIDLCLKAGLHVILPLHDQLFIELEETELHKIDLFDSLMHDAFFAAFFDRYSTTLEEAKLIRTDLKVWGHNLKNEMMKTPKGLEFFGASEYIDSRSKKEYEFFKEYLTPKKA